jgi:hypothetical protein
MTFWDLEAVGLTVMGLLTLNLVAWAIVTASAVLLGRRR